MVAKKMVMIVVVAARSMAVEEGLRIVASLKRDVASIVVAMIMMMEQMNRAENGGKGEVRRRE